MKIKSIIFSAIVALGAAFTSCSEEGYWEAYAPTAEQADAQYSFAAKNNSYSFGSSEKPASINVVMHRGNTSADATVPVKATFSNEGLSGAESVTFKAGESTANYEIMLDENLAPGNYKATVALADSSYYSPSAIPEVNISLTIEYVWEEYSKASINDMWLGVENEDVVVMKAVGEPIYRLIKPFWPASIETWWEETLDDATKAVFTTKMIELSVDENGLVYYDTFLYGPYDTESGDNVYGYHPSNYNASYDEAYSPMNAVVSENQIQLVPIMYVPNVGGFGPKQFVITLTDEGKTF